MPTDLPDRAGADARRRQSQAAMLSDALSTADAFLVSHVLRELSVAHGRKHALGDDPKLSAVLEVVTAFGMELTANPRE